MASGTKSGATLVLDALAARFGGTAYAVPQLASALLRRPEVARVVVVTRKGSIVDRSLRPAFGLRIIRVAHNGPLELLRRIAWETARLPRRCHGLSADALFSFSGMVPRSPRCSVISLLANPVPFEDRRSVGSLLRRAAIIGTSRRATAIFVPSSYLQQLVGPAPNVHVVPLGVDRKVFAPRAAPGSEILYVGDFYVHKRHDLILQAYSALPADRPTLRLIGNPDVDPRNFRAVCRQAEAIAGVRVDGRVDFSTLRRAYGDARIFALPSERESFSMPLAEALACGVPAVARDHPALRETAGPAALFVAGDDVSGWTAALGRMLADDALHQRLRDAGVAHAARFSWDSMAERLLEHSCWR